MDDEELISEEKLIAWEKRMLRHESLDRALQLLKIFIKNPTNQWPLYDGLKQLLGQEKACEIADLLEI